MHRSAALHWKHGRPVTLRWPPVDTSHYRLAVDPETSEFEKIEFQLDLLPAARGPLSPVPNPLRVTIDDPFRNSPLTGMQPYRSIGSKNGALWFSSWLSPRKLPRWEYLPALSGGNWFAPLDWSRSELARNTTLWIPFWALTGSYTVAWLAVLVWRADRRMRQARSHGGDG